jgi:hypothetical protein
VLHYVARPCPAPVLIRSHLVNPIQFEERLAYNLDNRLILVLFQAGEKMFLPSTFPEVLWGPHRYLLNGQRCPFPGVKRPGREANRG